MGGVNDDDTGLNEILVEQMLSLLKFGHQKNQ